MPRRARDAAVPERFSVRRLFRILGPGLITGSADDDPSGIATYSQAGAAFQYGLLWTAVLQIPLMIGVQLTCARIGIVSGRDIGRVLRERYSLWLLGVVTILLAIANTVTAGADLAAIGAAAKMIAHVPESLAILISALALIAILVFGSYDVVANVLKWLTLGLLAYMISGVLAGPHWLEVLRRSVVPSIDTSEKYLALFVAVFGTTISPYMFVWQSGEEVDQAKEERGTSLAAKLRDAREDTIVGMSFSQVIGWFVIVAAGATLFPAGHRDIQTANEAAQALAPLGHGIGKILFSVGIIGPGLLAVPTLVGATAFVVAGLAHAPAGMRRPPSESKVFSATIAVGVVVASALALSGLSPVGMLLASAVINGALAAPLLIVVLLVANNRAVMGDHRNGWLLNCLVIAAAAIMGGSSLWLGGLWLVAHV